MIKATVGQYKKKTKTTLTKRIYILKNDDQ